MAEFVFSMNQSLDGYVNYDKFAPGPELFRHFVEQVRGLTGSIYGRKIYEIMRYWDEEHPEWNGDEREFAVVWRKQPKWVVSETLTSVGPNATLISQDIESAVRKIKQEQTGEIDVAGPVLAKTFTELGLIDKYRIYLHPVVLGGGDPFFVSARPPLRLTESRMMDDTVIRLTYVPAMSQ